MGPLRFFWKQYITAKLIKFRNLFREILAMSFQAETRNTSTCKSTTFWLGWSVSVLDDTLLEWKEAISFH